MNALRLESIVGHWAKKGSSLRVPDQGGISLSADIGEWILVAGRNGSGKTTFFEALCGFTDRMTGAIYLDGQLISLGNARSCFLAGIQYVPQRAFFSDNLFWNDAVDLMRCNRKALYNMEAISDLHNRLCDLGLIKHAHPIEPRIFDLILALLSVPRVLILDEIAPSIEVCEIYTSVRELVPMTVVLFTDHDSKVGVKSSDSILWLKENIPPDFFSVKDRAKLNDFLENTADRENNSDIRSASTTTRNWHQVLKPQDSPYEHVRLVMPFCSKEYFAATNKHFRNRKELGRRIFSDFPFLSLKKKETGHLSGGQQLVLAWFLLDYIGVGTVPESDFRHLDGLNKGMIDTFWSKVKIGDVAKA